MTSSNEGGSRDSCPEHDGATINPITTPTHAIGMNTNRSPSNLTADTSHRIKVSLPDAFKAEHPF